MSARNPLLDSPPHAVEAALSQLGRRLRTARLRRNLSVEAVAKKIGAGVRAVGDAEKGKPSTGIAVYAALLWAFDMLGEMDALADPAVDAEGLALVGHVQRTRARRRRGLDNEF
jgi:transcriptional regulator with XRE-family HTH domain